MSLDTFLCSCFKFWFGFSLWSAVEVAWEWPGLPSTWWWIFAIPRGKLQDRHQVSSTPTTLSPTLTFLPYYSRPCFDQVDFVIWRLSLMNRASPSMAISSPELFGLCIGVVESPNPFIRLSLKKRGLWSSPLIRCKLRRWSADSSE